MFEVVLLEVARVVYDDLGPTDQAEVDQLFGILELKPWLDGVHTFHDPTTNTDVYDNGAWSIEYKLVSNAFVEVWSIWRAMPPYKFKDVAPGPIL